ncbi:restriction endonuclease subunit S [Pseudomonas argentinensis]|uniref:restriction endonuclease subunit S n=1 Tax=Phytopseudomonas argentinensis TaxID=289370 RepID=UPI0008A8D3CA|nr:restriction endonuclease subunit S [Pseudomonas argentinensis]
MSELPSGWARTSLGEIATWGSGGTPSRSEPNFYGGSIPWIKSGELNARYVKSTEENITEAAVSGSSAKIFPAGSVAIAMYGATIGKTAILGVDAATNQACAVGAPIEGLTSSEFLYRLLQNEKDAFIEKGKGGAQPNISQAVIKAHEVSLPPLAEQTRIAQKLDELLAQVDTLKARIDGIPALLKRFRQSVLAAAVSGRLTEEWRGLQSDSLPQSHSADMPAGWSVIPLGNYAANHDGARKPISAKERESRKGDHPYFGATGQIDRIDGYTHDGEFVLVGEDGANLLTRAKPLAFIAKGQIWVNNHAHVIASPSGHSNTYLAIYLNTLDITPWVSGSAQPKLNQKNMNEIPVHVPPPAEQVEIVHRVEQLFAFADQLEAKVASAKSRIDHLTQSILAKAFRGELVPQDPNDEPASVLLERIKAQRAAAPKAKRGRKASA